MKKKGLAIFTFSHIIFLAVGFALGIYALPILTAPPAPSKLDIQAKSSNYVYLAEFTSDLKGSDLLHWGEGRLSIGNDYITLMGQLAPGPDYKLYLSPKFVETESEFEQLKLSMILIGNVKTFDNFIVGVDAGIDLTTFNTVVVWCETFGEFITAAQYR